MPPAQFRPGTRHAYSNIGYCRLGQVIARVSGMSYARYVEQAILAPRGAHLIYEGAPTVRHSTHWPDAAFAALGPGGGWTGSAMEYWRFAAGPMDPRVAERPGYARPGEAYYGLGWRIWPVQPFRRDRGRVRRRLSRARACRGVVVQRAPAQGCRSVRAIAPGGTQDRNIGAPSRAPFGPLRGNGYTPSGSLERIFSLLSIRSPSTRNVPSPTACSILRSARCESR